MPLMNINDLVGKEVIADPRARFSNGALMHHDDRDIEIRAKTHFYEKTDPKNRHYKNWIYWNWSESTAPVTPSACTYSGIADLPEMTATYFFMVHE